uniref:Uncharacterized protein n=1 Tax=viral metagenome TaxID=1070528 RepID=A0A6C0K5Z1_9ZZZZ
MGEEKIFKDLTKKYAELAKKIHSKDKKSSSLIKSCSKRIALLDKLRVLEVSYLKCLKNKVKRGQKGGAGEEDEEDEEANQQQAAGIINKALDEAGTTIEDEGTQINDNKERALAICTTALEKSMDLKDVVKGFINKKMEEISKGYEGIDTDETKELLKTKLLELRNDLEKKKIITGDEAKAYLVNAGQIIAGKVGQTYNNYKDITLEEALTKISQIGEKSVEKARQGVGIVKTTFKNNTGIDADEVLRRGIGIASKTVGIAKNRVTNFLGITNQQPPQQQTNPSGTGSTGGSKKTSYRLNGEKVVLSYKNKKVQRSIYVKGNGKTKYCKINKEYVLLSKVKNKIQ